METGVNFCAEPGSEKIFFSSDSHFGHRLMARERGFNGDINAMDKVLIDNWNAVVRQNDVVYHLGDFSFRKREETLGVLHQLNGRIRFIRGNHDGVVKSEVLSCFEWQKNYYEMKGPDGVKIVLSHFPFEVWNKSHYSSWHLHGHCHGSLRTTRDIKRIDVGVDTNDLKPYSMEEIEAIMAKRGYEAVDHHTKRR